MNLTTVNRTCRAAVFTAAGQPISLRDVSIPALRDGEVLVRVTCCTICGSDLHTYTGRRAGPVPCVLGHEIIGQVTAVSDTAPADVSGQPVQIGDHVTWSVAACCGRCRRCERGLPQKCESLFKYGHEVCNAEKPLSGGLAEYCVLQQGTAIVGLPDGSADKIFCPASCATATVAAAVRRGGTLAGRRVLIFGAGMLGLTASAFACADGAAEVCLCDTDPDRLQRGSAFGATQTRMAPLSDTFDCVFEMSGSPAAVESAINAAAVGGHVVLVGSVSPSPAVSVDPERIVRRLLSIHGVHNYRPDDLVCAVRFLGENSQRFPFADLVEHSYSLADVNEAFEFAGRERPVRVAVVP